MKTPFEQFKDFLGDPNQPSNKPDSAPVIWHGEIEDEQPAPVAGCTSADNYRTALEISHDNLLRQRDQLAKALKRLMPYADTLMVKASMSHQFEVGYMAVLNECRQALASVQPDGRQ